MGMSGVYLVSYFLKISISWCIVEHTWMFHDRFTLMRCTGVDYNIRLDTKYHYGNAMRICAHGIQNTMIALTVLECPIGNARN